MRKPIAALLALCMLLGLGAAFAEVDLSYVQASPNIFDVDETDDGLIFIDSTLSSEQVACTHEHESDSYYSCIYWELAIVDNEPPVYPLLTVSINADQPLNIRAVSFDVDGRRFTFDVAEDISRKTEEGNTREFVTIFLGPTNIEFLIAMENVSDACGTDLDAMRAVRITGVLHGDEDIAIALSENFVVDFFLVIEDAWLELGGLDTFSEITFDTPMTESEIPADAVTENGTVTEEDLTDTLLNLWN